MRFLKAEPMWKTDGKRAIFTPEKNTYIILTSQNFARVPLLGNALKLFLDLLIIPQGSLFFGEELKIPQNVLRLDTLVDTKSIIESIIEKQMIFQRFIYIVVLSFERIRYDMRVSVVLYPFSYTLLLWQQWRMLKII